MEQHSESAGNAQKNLETMLTRFLPSPIAHKLSVGEVVQPQVYNRAAVALIHINMFQDLAKYTSASQVISFLSQLHNVLDPYVGEKNIHVISDHSDHMTIICGVGGAQSNQSTNMLILAKTCTKIFEELAAIEHPFGNIKKLNGESQENEDKDKDKDSVAIQIDSKMDGNTKVSSLIKMVLHTGSASTGVVGSAVPR